MPNPLAKLLLRATVILTSIAVLSGCVASNDPLFDAESGVTVLSVGRYTRQEYIVGNWVTRETWRFSRVGMKYSWSEKSDDEKGDPSSDQVKFTLHDIGAGFYVAMIEKKIDDYNYVYDLVEITKDGVLRYNVDCEAVKLLPAIFNRRFDLKVVRSFCIVSSADDLKKLLREYAKRSFAKHRYVPSER